MTGDQVALKTMCGSTPDGRRHVRCRALHSAEPQLASAARRQWARPAVRCSRESPAHVPAPPGCSLGRADHRRPLEPPLSASTARSPSPALRVQPTTAARRGWLWSAARSAHAHRHHPPQRTPIDRGRRPPPSPHPSPARCHHCSVLCLPLCRAPHTHERATAQRARPAVRCSRGSPAHVPAPPGCSLRRTGHRRPLKPPPWTPGGRFWHKKSSFLPPATHTTMPFAAFWAPYELLHTRGESSAWPGIKLR